MDQKKFENKHWENTDQKLEFRHNAILGMIGSGKVLDIGCGDGLLLGELKKRGIESKGIDFSEIAIKKCIAKGLDAEKFDISVGKFSYIDNEFNYCIISDVLEHLFSPAIVLSEGKRISQHLIISVPNFNSLPARMQMLRGKVPENNKPKKGHIYWFNYSILRKMIGDNDLEIVEIKMNTFWEKKLIIGRVTKILLKFFPNIFALSFVVKARKKYER